MLSRETISRRGKKILFPIFIAFLLDFLLFAIRWQMTGDSGTVTGQRENSGFLLVEHGRTIHVSALEYVLCRFQLASLVLLFVSLFIARAYLLWSGDVRKCNRV